MSAANMIDAGSHTQVTSKRSRTRPIPASGNAALAASGLIQAAIGVEFFLSGLNKFADPNFVRNFRLFVDASPGTHTGLLAPLIHAIVQPNIAFFAGLTKDIELGLGIVLLLGAIEVGRRRLSGRIAAQHGYEAPVALVASLAGLGAAGLSLSLTMEVAVLISGWARRDRPVARRFLARVRLFPALGLGLARHRLVRLTGRRRRGKRRSLCSPHPAPSAWHRM